MDYNNLPGPDMDAPGGGEPEQNAPAQSAQAEQQAVPPTYPPNAPGAQPYQPPAPVSYPAQNAGQQTPPPPPPPQYYQPYPQQPPVYPQPAPSDGKRGMAIASMVTGIVAIVMSILVSCALFLGLPCSVASIILGCVSLKSSGRGMAIAGIACGAVAALILLLWLILIVIGISVGEGYYNYYY